MSDPASSTTIIRLLPKGGGRQLSVDGVDQHGCKYRKCHMKLACDGRWRPLSEETFCPSKRLSSGFLGHCRDCHNERIRRAQTVIRKRLREESHASPSARSPTADDTHHETDAATVSTTVTLDGGNAASHGDIMPPQKRTRVRTTMVTQDLSNPLILRYVNPGLAETIFPPRMPEVPFASSVSHPLSTAAAAPTAGAAMDTPPPISTSTAVTVTAAPTNSPISAPSLASVASAEIASAAAAAVMAATAAAATAAATAAAAAATNATLADDVGALATRSTAASAASSAAESAAADAALLFTASTKEPDALRAFQLALLAAEKGSCRAQNNVAVEYEQGLVVPMDAVAALKWYEEAKRKGSVNAHNNLGRVFETGVLGQAVDLDRARAEYRLSAKLGDPQAKTHIARITNKIRKQSLAQTRHGRFDLRPGPYRRRAFAAATTHPSLPLPPPPPPPPPTPTLAGPINSLGTDSAEAGQLESEPLPAVHAPTSSTSASAAASSIGATAEAGWVHRLAEFAEAALAQRERALREQQQEADRLQKVYDKLMRCQAQEQQVEATRKRLTEALRSFAPAAIASVPLPPLPLSPPPPPPPPRP